MQKPFIATMIVGIAWALSRLPRTGSSDDLDRRLPSALAGVKRPRRPRRKPDPFAGGVPVEPRRPNLLSGGAVAQLDVS